MAYVAVDKNEDEWIYDEMPYKNKNDTKAKKEMKDMGTILRT